VDGGHLGLVSIREWAEEVSGQWQLTSEPGQGTQEMVHRPLLMDGKPLDARPTLGKVMGVHEPACGPVSFCLQALACCVSAVHRCGWVFLPSAPKAAIIEGRRLIMFFERDRYPTR
jgi:hypothetical protein